MATLTIRLTEKLEELISKEKEITGLSKNAIIIMACKEFLEKKESE